MRRVAFALGLILACDRTYPASPVVRLDDGNLVGDVREDRNGGRYLAFQSIPYAKPPLGELRFKLGIPVKLVNGPSKYLWQNVVNAFEACPDGTILTAAGGGNTGNAVWEHLSVLAVAHLLPDRQFKPYITVDVKTKLEKVFKTISWPLLPSVAPGCYSTSTIVAHHFHSIADIDDIARTAKCVTLDRYAARYQDILTYGLENIRKNLKFRDEIVEAVQNKLGQIRDSFVIPEGIKETFVAIHYRGGDYKQLLKDVYQDDFKNFPTHTYFLKAMDYFKARYEFPIFVFVTSDHGWLDANLARLRVRGTNLFVKPFVDDKPRDMALLAHCNHSIITYGTFGATGAFYNGGETVVYDLGTTVANRTGPALAMSIAGIKDNWMLMKN